VRLRSEICQSLVQAWWGFSEHPVYNLVMSLYVHRHSRWEFIWRTSAVLAWWAARCHQIPLQLIAGAAYH